MRFQCPNCQTRFRLKDSDGGKRGICSLCNSEFVLPIPDPEMLLQWAANTPYDKLVRFINNNAAKGHSIETIRELVKIREQRRWEEEDRNRATIRKDRARPVRLTKLDQVWEAAQRREAKKLSLEGLRGLEPSRFESFVAGLFTMQGHIASVVGGTADFGIDVEIRDATGNLWAVAQCKRYAQKSKVRTAQVMEFAGAFLLSKAQKGFIFSTGELTRNARTTAAGFNWLTVYSGTKLVQYIEQLNQVSEVPAPPELPL